MKVSIDWLKELVELGVPIEELIRLIPLRTIGTKEVTRDFIELDMKGYNRADLLSMRGTAYELAAITDSKIKFEEIDAQRILEQLQDDKADVQIQTPQICTLYCVAKIENLKVEQSNESWIKKLSDCGLRSVNNIADITNLTMLEYGQPFHAFDAKNVIDEKIIIRTAKTGERITTLDGKTRDLKSSDILITDNRNILGIAGIMGGKESEVSDLTTAILLEAAIFDPVLLRKTANRLGIQSEASKRFYHGLAAKNLFQALAAAIKMYEDIGGRLTALTIVGERDEEAKKIPLRLKNIQKLIGVDITKEQVEKLLSKLHFDLELQQNVHPEGGIAWDITPPYWRLDIGIQEDLIEEIARMFGYENIPSRKLIGKLPDKIDQDSFELVYKLKKALSSLGLTEIQTYSFFSTDVLKSLELEKGHLIKVANPISSETEYLRSDIWPNLLETAAKNIKHGYADIAIFEIGKIYTQKDKTPDEKQTLGILLMNNTQNPIEELFQIFQQFNIELNLKSVLGEKLHDSGVELLHPNRKFKLLKDATGIGNIAEIHPRMVNRFGVDKRVAILEIDLTKLL